MSKLNTYAVGLIVTVQGEQQLIVDAVEAASSAEALGKMIMEHKVKSIVAWKIKGNDLDQQVLEMVRDGNKISAIKLVKDTLGIGLRDAKHYVDDLM